MKAFILRSLLFTACLIADLRGSLVAHYRFDETSGGMASDALGTSDATIEGNVGFVAGVDGGAFQFDGDIANNITVADPAFLSGDGLGADFTISVWISFTEVSSNVGAVVSLVDQAGPANSYTDLSRIGNGAFGGGMDGSMLGRTRIGNAITQSAGGGNFGDGNFHHVVFVVDSSNGIQEVYVDGERVSTIVGEPQIASFTDLTIGHLDRPAGAAQTDVDAFTGLVDDLQLYTGVLDGADIEYLFENPGSTIGETSAPEVSADAVTMHHGGKVLLDVLSNDSSSAVASSLELVDGPAFGSAVVNPSGEVLYAHSSGSPESDSFTYRVADLAGNYSLPAEVVLHFSHNLRIENTTLKMPDTAPAMDFSVVDAFPGLTFNKPTTMECPPHELHRLFVAERAGKVFVIPDVASPSPSKELYLDLSGITLNDGNEQGLKGFAFHPEFAANGYFFVAYNHLDDGLEYVRLSRFKSASPSSNSPISAESEEILINQLYDPESGNQPRIHNIDECNFGPDGYLYVALGDSDGHPDPSENSQRIDKDFWSALLRIDVDLEAEDYTPDDGTGDDDESLAPNAHPAVVLHDGYPLYEIPADNPFIGLGSFNGVLVDPADIRSEFFAVGLRNPWQFSFDSLNGNLWLADVGLGSREEVNLISKGGNYGWAFYEGTDPRKGTPPPEAVLTDPVWEYEHGNGPLQGKSVIGGLVYRGNQYASLYGKYLFGDYVSGNIWAMNSDGSSPVVERIAGESGVVAFAIDPSDSSLLMLDHGDGVIRRLMATSVAGEFPGKLSETGVFADLTDLSPNPGVVAYEPNLAFWSDHAVKSRWFSIKDSMGQFTYQGEGSWDVPDGAVFVKHFELELERGDPESRKRIETRLLVQTAAGVYGVSYRWNELGTDADLVTEGGESFDLPIVDQAGTNLQTWQIPSRSQCNTCHGSEGGEILSLNTRQLNRPGTLAGSGGNFLSLLEAAGYLNELPQSPNNLPRHVRPDESRYTLEARVRSYLDVNCAYCHRSGGSGGGEFDLRSSLPLAATGVVNGTSSSADAPYKLVVPGDHGLSVIWNRISAENGFTRMPPLATSELDAIGIQLLKDWVDDSLSGFLTYDQWRIESFGSLHSADGQRDSDPDKDGLSNYDEFLVHSDPLSGSSMWTVGIAVDETSVSFPNLPHRKIIVECGTDLQSWDVWDIPGNDGLPITSEVRTFPRDRDLQEQFFRLLIEEP